MGETTQGSIVRVGVDLAKQVIQVHAVDGAGRRVAARVFKRDQFFAWCAAYADLATKFDGRCQGEQPLQVGITGRSA